MDNKAGFAKFVVLTKSLQTGEIIGVEDVSLVSRDTNPGVGYFRDIKDVVGRRQNEQSISIKLSVPDIWSLIMLSRKINL